MMLNSLPRFVHKYIYIYIHTHTLVHLYVRLHNVHVLVSFKRAVITNEETNLRRRKAGEWVVLMVYVVAQCCTGLTCESRTDWIYRIDNVFCYFLSELLPTVAYMLNVCVCVCVCVLSLIHI